MGKPTSIRPYDAGLQVANAPYPLKFFAARSAPRLASLMFKLRPGVSFSAILQTAEHVFDGKERGLPVAFNMG
jgi:hypothetical protein